MSVHSLPDDAREILHARLSDLMEAAEAGTPDKRRTFARRARNAAALLDGASVTPRAHPYAAAWLRELAARAEANAVR